MGVKGHDITHGKESHPLDAMQKATNLHRVSSGESFLSRDGFVRGCHSGKHGRMEDWRTSKGKTDGAREAGCAESTVPGRLRHLLKHGATRTSVSEGLCTQETTWRCGGVEQAECSWM